MKKPKFTETQIVKALKEYEGGLAAKDFAMIRVSLALHAATGSRSTAICSIRVAYTGNIFK